MDQQPHGLVALWRELSASFGVGIAGGLAVVVKLLLSPTQSWRRALATACAAILAAYVGVDPLMELLGWSTPSQRNLIAALLALTGENIVRRILDASERPGLLRDLWDLWRGRP